MSRVLETEILIIGAGSTGLCIARELSRYQVDVTVVDKNADVCLGQVKASWGSVYSAIGLTSADSLFLKSAMTPELRISKLFERDTLKTRLTVEGFRLFSGMAEDLDIPFRLGKRILLGSNDDDFKALEIVEEVCRSMDINPEHLDQEAIQDLEPHVSNDIKFGLAMDNDVGFIYSWEFGFALVENAQYNGARILLQTEVLGIKSMNGWFLVETNQGKIRTRFIVNAAGLYADKIAQMAGVCDFGFNFFCNMALVTDRRVGYLLNHNVSFVSYPGRPRGLAPTRSGNILIGCSGFHPVHHLVNASSPTRREWIEESMVHCKTLIPAIREQDIITSYSGVYQINTRDPEDHLIEVSKGNRQFINAVVRMPSLAMTPAISKYVVNLLGNQGLDLKEKAEFNPRRKGIPKPGELSDQERSQLIAQDSRYGHIVCRCEGVSEGEIVEAIRRGARTVSGVKYRTRAGMGRCQMNTCGPKIVEILSRELDMPEEEIIYKGAGSRVLGS
ncbi:MAG: FAD-dependent oxidoreductase [Deltaproteobacteria bacterium]|nr:FAD-dependent oxidoreductase [Deltaproteobacteria bacterium]MBW2138825.1 FAD-dependent oxidoreductase [Deltaproteobacteria bacterium]